MVTRNTRQRPIKAVVLRVRAPSAARKEALRLRLETDAIEADGLTFVRPVTRRDCEGATRPCPWGLTDCEVAARLNLVRSRVWQIEVKARAKVGPVLGMHRA